MRFLRSLLFLACLAVSGAACAIPFSSLFVFGDSNSDNGRRLALQGTKPAPPYFMGRHSNGLVAVEHLAAGLGLGGAQFVDYAVGGALSGHGNVDAAPVLAATGLLDQLSTFQAGHPAADSGALYFIYGGDNDINECKGASNASCTTAQIQAVVANLGSLVQGLSDLGARHFMVIGSYGGGADKNEFRTLLPAAMQLLDAALAGDILYFNARPVLLDMIAAGNPYGFTHTSSTSPCYTGELTGGGSVCPDPDTYVFWDDRGHLTAPAHAILGRAMLAAVPAPATSALLLLGLAGLGMRRRRMKDERGRMTPRFACSLAVPAFHRFRPEIQLPTEGDEKSGHAWCASRDVILGLRPRPAALHRGGRSPARTCAGTFFEFPAHPSSFILRNAAAGDPEDDDDEEEEKKKPQEEEEEDDDGEEKEETWQVKGKDEG